MSASCSVSRTASTMDVKPSGKEREKAPISENPPSPYLPPSNASSSLSDEHMPSNASRRMRRMKWVQRLKDLSPSLTLENSGSVARDHLASERTFLAYVRTSLGCSTTGVALVQLFSLSSTNTTPEIRRVGNVLGAIIAMMGVAVMFIGTSRYFQIQKALLDGKFDIARYTAYFMALVLCAMVIITFGLLVGMTRR